MFHVTLPDSHQNLRLSYDRHGSGPIKILFIAGLRTEGRAWKFQIDFFKEFSEFEFVTFDNRGCGKSSSPSTFHYTTTQMAKDALFLIDSLSWARCHVVGISMGGMISMELALLAPERILSLTLMVTHAGGLMARSPLVGIRHILRTFVLKTEQEILENFLQMLYSSKTLNDPERKKFFYEYQRKQWKTSSPIGLIGNLGQMGAVQRHFVSFNDLLRIRYANFPTLIFVSSEDRLIRRENSFLLAKIFGGRLVELENCAHDLAAESCDRVNEELNQFFRSVKNETRRTSIFDEKSLELEALRLCCEHRIHCFLHDFFGFFKGFFISLFVSLILTGSLFDKKILLTICSFCALFRSVRCVLNGVRSRNFVIEKNLFVEPGENRRGVPKIGPFEFPIFPIVFSVGLVLILISTIFF